MQTKATVETEKAERYMKALVNHFSRKVNAEYSENSGFVDFGFGRCDLTAENGTLTLQATSESQQGLSQLQRVMGSHLVRFTQNEVTALTWYN